MNTTANLQSLTFKDAKTYLTAALFIAGNLIMPQMFHLIPQGGVTWLPIYFFTLIGAYMFGSRVGLLTAIASPILNAALFGMPLAGALPAIMMKSVLLAVLAGLAAAKSRKFSLLTICAVVLGYQIVGTAGEWLLTGDLAVACQDFRIGIPGMLLQTFGGYFLIKKLKRL